MKIERINEFQIRCILTNFDLSIRNLQINDLAYGSDKTGALFNEMMERASHEVNFDAEDTPLMVEAIPMANESVMLIITKLEDPEELDTRFSKFSQLVEEEEPSWPSFPSELLEGAKILSKIEELAEGETAVNEGNTPPNPVDPASFMRIYLFDSLDLVCDAAKQTGAIFGGSSVLYKNPSNGKFYLILKREDSDEQNFHCTCNILSDYGVRQKYDKTMEAYYEEHYELFIRKNALNVLSTI